MFLLSIFRFFQQATITVDGSPSDWQSIQPIITDPEGDNTCGSGSDIKTIFLTYDDQYLYWRMD